jgi:hypothetical protein
MNIAAIKEKLDELDKRLPVRETLMLPSDIFFSREIPLPEGTLPAEIQSYAQLQVEAIAPFPIENLAWGYLAGTSSVLVYAATEERAASFALNGFDNIWNAFPAFIPFALLAPAAEDTLRLCVSAGSASALWVKAGQTIPYKIQSCRIPEGTPLSTDEEILAYRPALLETLALTDAQKLEEGVRFLEHVDDKSDDKIVFRTRHISEKTPKASHVFISISGDALWNADTRGRAFAVTTGADRRKSSIIWKAFAAACIAAAALFIASIGLVATKTTAAVYRAIVRHNTAQVELLQNKSDFAANLESVTEREMKPFSMLAVANSKRPSGLYYERASSSDWNTLHLEGGAQRSELIQGYIEELGKDPFVHNVRTLRTATTGGNSTFDIEVVFNPLDDVTTGN